MNCPNCGNQLMPGMNFCQKCGAPVTQQQFVPQPPVKKTGNKKILVIVISIVVAVVVAVVGFFAYVFFADRALKKGIEALEENESNSETTSDFSTTEPTTAVTTTTTTEATTQELNLFRIIPSEFIFSSGAGAWGTQLVVNPDGTFSGEYSDFNAGTLDPAAPEGEEYLSQFNGRFSQPVKVNEYTYRMRVTSLNTVETPGTEYIENGMKIICTEPAGLEKAGEVMVYLPGTPVSELPEEVTSWCFWQLDGKSKVPQGMYILYSVEDMAPFVNE